MARDSTGVPRPGLQQRAVAVDPPEAGQGPGVTLGRRLLPQRQRVLRLRRWRHRR